LKGGLRAWSGKKQEKRKKGKLREKEGKMGTGGKIRKRNEREVRRRNEAFSCLVLSSQNPRYANGC